MSERKPGDLYYDDASDDRFAHKVRTDPVTILPTGERMVRLIITTAVRDETTGAPIQGPVESYLLFPEMAIEVSRNLKSVTDRLGGD